MNEIEEIRFYDKKLKREVRYDLKNDTWIDEDGNETGLEEIEHQLNNYAKPGTIKIQTELGNL